MNISESSPLPSSPCSYTLLEEISGRGRRSGGSGRGVGGGGWGGEGGGEKTARRTAAFVHPE